MMTRKFGVVPAQKSAIGLVIVTLGALVACGGSQESNEATTPVATKARAAAVSVPNALVGTWWTRLSSQDATVIESNPGKVAIKISADGTLAIYYPDANVAKDCSSDPYCEPGQIKGRGARLTIGSTTMCSGGDAQYSFKIVGDKLRTKSIKEDCVGDRPALFDGTTWHRQS
jgi:hypothetical protein